MTKRPLIASALLLGFAVALALAAPSGTPPSPSPITRRGHGENTIEFPATVHAAAFERRLLGMGMPGYHLIVWKGGGAAHAALFQAEVTDTQLLDALEALGAKPGNNLPMETWEERNDPKSKAPDLIIAGPTVDVLVRLPGHNAPISLGQILEDKTGKGLEMRLGGNRANIPKWKSGCIACLYSCPGSKLGNARATVRDYTRNPDRYHVRQGVLPEDGTKVTIVLRLAAKSHA
jgi:hypothetical protein